MKDHAKTAKTLTLFSNRWSIYE